MHTGELALKKLRVVIRSRVMFTLSSCSNSAHRNTLALEDRALLQSQAIILGPNCDFYGQIGEEISTLGTISTALLAIWTKVQFHTHFKPRWRLQRPISEPGNDWNQRHPIKNTHCSSKDTYKRREALEGDAATEKREVLSRHSIF